MRLSLNLMSMYCFVQVIFARDWSMVERTARTQDHGQGRRTRTGGHESLVSQRGKVLENGMPRFFRRLAEGVFDIPDLKRRTKELVYLIAAFRIEHKLSDNRIIAVRCSNGANIAVSLLLLHPSSLCGAVLFRAMAPFQPDSRPDLNGTSVFMSFGQLDPIALPENALELARIFKDAGADVSLHRERGGHQLRPEDIETARKWLLSVNKNRGRGLITDVAAET
jgi:predicted esterase